jgi:hypothetical protein
LVIDVATRAKAGTRFVWFFGVSQNTDPQANKPGNSKPAYDIVCSWCGALIRSSNIDTPEQMCLICHARMLNDYFRRLRQLGSEKRRGGV